MPNYPQLFEQADFFSWSLFYTFYNLSQNPFDKQALAKLQLLDDCLRDYNANYSSLGDADIELLVKIEGLLSQGWDPKHSLYNELYDIRIMELCKVNIKLSDSKKYKQLYVKHAADYSMYIDKEVDVLQSAEQQTRKPLELLSAALQYIACLPENKALEERKEQILTGIDKLKHFDTVVEAKRKEYEEKVKNFLKNREVHEGNEIIKRYVAGNPGGGRCEWIRYFYTECEDVREIEKQCEELFGGYNEDDAEGYVGAYTHLERLSKHSIAYMAGFNYSFEQMEANYD